MLFIFNLLIYRFLLQVSKLNLVLIYFCRFCILKSQRSIFNNKVEIFDCFKLLTQLFGDISPTDKHLQIFAFSQICQILNLAYRTNKHVALLLLVKRLCWLFCCRIFLHDKDVSASDENFVAHILSSKKERLRILFQFICFEGHLGRKSATQHPSIILSLICSIFKPFIRLRRLLIPIKLGSKAFGSRRCLLLIQICVVSDRRDLLV